MKSLIQQLAVAVFAGGLVAMACAESGQEDSKLMGSTVDQGEQVTPAFDDLDKDQDGYINAVEATGDPSLMDHWTSVDANTDRKIDQSEFSKFETSKGQSGVSETQEHKAQKPQEETQPQRKDAKPQY